MKSAEKEEKDLSKNVEKMSNSKLSHTIAGRYVGYHRPIKTLRS